MTINQRKIKKIKYRASQSQKSQLELMLLSKIVGKLLFISGQISIDEKWSALIKGKVGEDLTTEDGYNAAKRCALSIVSHVKICL